MAETYREQAAGAHLLGRILVYTLLIVFALYYLMPLFVMITTSLKTLDDIRAGNLVALPREITLEAWAKAWASACTGVDCSGLKGNFWNSVSFTAASTCPMNLSTHTGTSRAVTASSARALAMLSAVLPRTHPHHAKPRIVIPNAPTTMPQKAGLHHGGTFITHLLSLRLALPMTILLRALIIIS